MSKTFLFQAIQFTQTIPFSISMPLVLFNPLIRPLSSATTPGQSGPGRNGNEEVLRISQSSNIAGTSPSDCLISYPGYSLVGVLPLCREAVGVFYSPSRLGNCLTWIISKKGRKWPNSYFFWGCCFQNLVKKKKKKRAAVLCSSRQASFYFSNISEESRGRIYTVVLTWPQLGRNHVLFYHSDQNPNIKSPAIGNLWLINVFITLLLFITYLFK